MENKQISNAAESSKIELTDVQNAQVKNELQSLLTWEGTEGKENSESNLPELTEGDPVNFENLLNWLGPKRMYDYYVIRFGLESKDTEQQTYDEQTEVLRNGRITTKTILEPPRTMLSIADVSVIERGDIYEIKGNPKSGKTSANKAMIASALSGKFGTIKAEESDLIVAYIDTEQKPSDTLGILNYIRKIANNVSDEYIDKHLFLFSLRMRDHTTLAKDLLRIVIDYRPDIIFADGIADFVCSFNDEVASKAIILLLLRIVEEFNCAIINLIHENKAYDDHHAKGHLGQLLTQKCAIAMETKKDGEFIKVTCSESRHKSMPDWYLLYDEHDMLCDASELYKELKQKESTVTKQLMVAQDIITESGGQIHRTELSKKMAEKLSKSESWMSTKITQFNGKGIYVWPNDMVKLTAPPEQED